MATSCEAPVLSKIYAISDIHVDYSKNKEFVDGWSDEKYQDCGLILAGDVSDSMDLLESTLSALKYKFKEVFYVPGNHELWLKNDKEGFGDSIGKFNGIIALCERLEVRTKPFKCQIKGGEAVWVVPLFSWYCKPEDDADDSLFFSRKSNTDNVRQMEEVWMDNHHCKWHRLLPPGMTQSRYFASLNERFLSGKYEHDVISFSHFVPNQDVIIGLPQDMAHVNQERRQLGLGKAPPHQGVNMAFNFTRYAGSRSLGEQVTRLGSVVHVYGHQHRNRDRSVRGIRYVSHCLGNVREQQNGWTWGLLEWNGPKQIWPSAEKSSDEATAN